ncbi:sigma-70 family RNA polymerase sigma factor [Leucobacter luti]|uniref:sigma-70 family RNA polymerase sigma factor n=1 Tax=Leucobacter luti TaxID=340320 RepID=UPI001C68BDB8|nr:sigma-70 family RNA polymerase sigma factor [Leucobacter luti]QYM75617.1 sigma-70 family RNA polymerase sigma factor [Leucobacter luti]
MNHEDAESHGHPPSSAPKSVHLAALPQLFRELSPRLRRYAFSLGATDAEADEVVSVTFESYLDFLTRNPEGVRNHEAYLVTIARNAFARLKRAAPDHFSVEQDLVVPARPFHDTLVIELEHTLLGGALQRVSDEDRRILALRLLEDRSSEDVAEELGITVVNARARLSRARRALRTEYLALYADSSAGTSCEPFIRPLAKFVAHGADAPPRRLAAHLATCASCGRVLNELRDEAGTGRRARAIVWGPIGLATLLQRAPGQQDRAHAVPLLALSQALVALGCALVLLLGIAQLLTPPGPSTDGSTGLPAQEREWSHPERGGPERQWLSVYPETTRLRMPAPGHEVEWDLGARNDALLSSLQVQLQVITKNQHLSDALRLTVATSTRTILDNAPLATLQGDGQTLGHLTPGEELSLRATLTRDSSDTDPALAAELSFHFAASTAVSEQTSGRAAQPTQATGPHPVDAFLLALTGGVLGGVLAVLAAALVLIGSGGILRNRSRGQRQNEQLCRPHAADEDLTRPETTEHRGHCAT